MVLHVERCQSISRVGRRTLLAITDAISDHEQHIACDANIGLPAVSTATVGVQAQEGARGTTDMTASPITYTRDAASSRRWRAYPPTGSDHASLPWRVKWTHQNSRQRRWSGGCWNVLIRHQNHPWENGRVKPGVLRWSMLSRGGKSKRLGNSIGVTGRCPGR